MGAKHTRLRTTIKDSLKRQFGGVWYTIHGNAFSAGLPDIIGCIEGKFVAIEVKVLPDIPSKLQLAEIDKINHEGEGCAFVAYSVNDAKRMVRRLLRRTV